MEIHSVKYEGIHIVKLSEVYLNPDYVEFALRCIDRAGKFENAELMRWGEKLYFSASVTPAWCTHAIKLFVSRVVFFMRFGYINVLSSPLLAYLLYTDLHREYLPRVRFYEGSDFKYIVNNGNHRLSIMRALGFKEIPVVLVSVCVLDNEAAVEKSLMALGQDINMGIVDFLKSQEWNRFKSGETYRKFFKEDYEVI